MLVLVLVLQLDGSAVVVPRETASLFAAGRIASRPKGVGGVGLGVVNTSCSGVRGPGLLIAEGSNASAASSDCCCS
jgi:hypothetical protein